MWKATVYGQLFQGQSTVALDGLIDKYCQDNGLPLVSYERYYDW